MFRGGPKILNMVAKVSAEFVRVCSLYDPSTFVCYPFEKLCPLPVAVLVCCNLSIQACALPSFVSCGVGQGTARRWLTDNHCLKSRATATTSPQPLQLSRKMGCKSPPTTISDVPVAHHVLHRDAPRRNRENNENGTQKPYAEKLRKICHF